MTKPQQFTFKRKEPGLNKTTSKKATNTGLNSDETRTNFYVRTNPDLNLD